MLLTTGDVAREMGVHEDTVRRWCTDGDLPATWFMNQWAIQPGDLEVFKENYKLLTTKQAAKQIGVNASTVSRWCNEGKLPAIWFMNRWAIRPDDLRACTDTWEWREAQRLGPLTAITHKQVLSDEVVAENKQRLVQVEQRATTAVYIQADGRQVTIQRGEGDSR